MKLSIDSRSATKQVHSVRHGNCHHHHLPRIAFWAVGGTIEQKKMKCRNTAYHSLLIDKRAVSNYCSWHAAHIGNWISITTHWEHLWKLSFLSHCTCLSFRDRYITYAACEYNRKCESSTNRRRLKSWRRATRQAGNNSSISLLSQLGPRNNPPIH